MRSASECVWTPEQPRVPEERRVQTLGGFFFCDFRVNSPMLIRRADHRVGLWR